MKTDISDTRIWNRKILNTYWHFIIIVTLIEFIVWFFDPNSRWYYFINYLLIPTTIMLITTVIAELVNKAIKKHHEYVIIFAGAIFAATLVNVNYDVHNIGMVFFLPTMIAISYIHKRLIWVTLFANLIIYFASVLLNKELQQMTQAWDFIVTVAILITTTFLALSIIQRGIQMSKSLVRSVEQRQELLIKNTLLDRLTKIDALTELYNHMTFHEYLDGLIENEFPSILALIDIDDFKKVNDTYGHRAGDVVLKRVAQIIGDTISPNDFASRYGGEEFAILFTETSMAAAVSVVEDIRRAIYAQTHIELLGSSVSVSIGIHNYKNNGKEAFFNGADRALYEAKRRGKNQTIKWHEGLHK